MAKTKIALVNQRYGLEVNGGSELHCRQLAEKLSEFYDVEVITTCALDYMTWENHYKEGVEDINGITVRRFRVEKQRNVKKFNEFSERIFSGKHTPEDEEKWIDEQGPYCPQAVEFIKKHHKDYKAVIFMTYLYYITARGMALDLDNSLIIPTAHDEPPIYLSYYRRVFENSKGFIYNTDEEKNMIDGMFRVEGIPHVIAGVGVDVPDDSVLFDAKKHYGLDDYIIYIGRIDESKGCGILFRYFLEYKKRNKGNLKLVLAGKPVMDIPESDDIIPLGFISDEEKFSLIRDSRALVLASEFESLSMVVLESMIYKRPVLVNGKCRVLKGHCTKSNAGLYFNNYFEFEGALSFLLTRDEEYAAMRENAKKYVDENYQWDIITGRIRGLVDGLE